MKYITSHITKLVLINLFIALSLMGCSNLSKEIRSIQGLSDFSYEEISKMTHRQFMSRNRTGYLLEKYTFSDATYFVQCADKNCISDDIYFIFKNDNTTPVVVNKQKLDDFIAEMNRKKEKKEAEILEQNKRNKIEQEHRQAKEAASLKRELDSYKNPVAVSIEKKAYISLAGSYSYYQITSSDDGPFFIDSIKLNGRCNIKINRVLRMGDYVPIDEVSCGKIVKIEIYTNRGAQAYRTVN